MQRTVAVLTLTCVGLPGCWLPGAPPPRPAAPDEPLPVVAEHEVRDPGPPVPEGRDALAFTHWENDGQEDSLRIGEAVVPLQAQLVPDRPDPLLELGAPFLGTGPIPRGVETPTGAVAQPSFLLYGSFRSAVQAYDDGDRTRSEWANRLDLYGELRLSGTERVVMGLRPIDNDRGGAFTGYAFHPGGEDGGWRSNTDGQITALFFEGDLGEMFPRLDPDDRGTLDWGLTVGRVPLQLQEGLLLDDTLDLVGVTRNSLTAPGLSNLRVSGIFGWNDINRAGAEDKSAQMVGLLAAADTDSSTVSLDMLYVDGGHDKTNAFYIGAGSTQRLGDFDTTFRIVGSVPVHGESPEVGTGALLFSEISKTLQGSDDIVYWNTYWSPDQFTSAARGRDRGSPVARTGILYDVVGMGRYGSPLGGDPDESIGTALGIQKFVGGPGEHVLFEFGARDSTTARGPAMFGIGGRWQRALSANQVIRVDAFVAERQRENLAAGVRAEWMVRF